MKNAIASLICLLIAHFGISQSDYPQFILTESGDTLIVFTLTHMDKMNATFVDLDGCWELNRNQAEELELRNQAESTLNARIAVLKDKEGNYKQIIIEKDSQLELLDNELKKQVRRNRFLKIKSALFTIGGIGVGLVGGYYGATLLKVN